MSGLYELMAAPFAACVVIVGIHAYLGMHVIQRRVIFVDLALAQIAALGATFGFLLGLSPHGSSAYLFSLGFAVVGAAIFAVTRMRHEKIPQEAIIGIVYAVAMAMAILVADRAPEGAEHIKETLVGSLLWVTWPTVAKTALVYALVGAVHITLRKRFFQISFDLDQAYEEGRWVRLWDFIFYITFAFVITISVAISGVLLVFSFLVIPAVIAALFADRIGARLAIGWIVGIAACLVGLVSSYRFDTPTGPTLVASLGIALVLAALIYYIRSAESRRGALLKTAAGITVVVGVAAAMAVFMTSGEFLHIEHAHEWEEDRAPRHPHEDLDDSWHEIVHACDHDPACISSGLLERDDWTIVLAAQLSDEDPGHREAAASVAGLIRTTEALDALAAAAPDEPDDLLRLEETRILASAGDQRGLALALAFLSTDAPLLYRDEANALLEEHSGQDFGYDAHAPPEANAEAIESWQEFLASAH
jgi:zinc/manganese transport system permease protein